MDFDVKRVESLEILGVSVDFKSLGEYKKYSTPETWQVSNILSRFNNSVELKICQLVQILIANFDSASIEQLIKDFISFKSRDPRILDEIVEISQIPYEPCEHSVILELLKHATLKLSYNISLPLMACFHVWSDNLRDVVMLLVLAEHH